MAATRTHRDELVGEALIPAPAHLSSEPAKMVRKNRNALTGELLGL
jgi:hypothetical protein